MKYFTKEWYEACQAADWCLNMAVQYKRIHLKVSGEALSGEKGTGFDEATIGSLRTDAGMPVLPFRTAKIEVK